MFFESCVFLLFGYVLSGNGERTIVGLWGNGSKEVVASCPLKEVFCLGRRKIGFASTTMRLVPAKENICGSFAHHVNLSLLIYVRLTTTCIL